MRDRKQERCAATKAYIPMANSASTCVFRAISDSSDFRLVSFARFMIIEEYGDGVPLVIAERLMTPAAISIVGEPILGLPLRLVLAGRWSSSCFVCR